MKKLFFLICVLLLPASVFGATLWSEDWDDFADYYIEHITDARPCPGGYLYCSAGGGADYSSMAVSSVGARSGKGLRISIDTDSICTYYEYGPTTQLSAWTGVTDLYLRFYFRANFSSQTSYKKLWRIKNASGVQMFIFTLYRIGSKTRFLLGSNADGFTADHVNTNWAMEDHYTPNTWICVEIFINQSEPTGSRWKLYIDDDGKGSGDKGWVSLPTSNYTLRGTQIGGNGCGNGYIGGTPIGVFATIDYDDIVVSTTYVGQDGGGDTTPPTVTAFNITPTTSTSRTVAISPFTATDAGGGTVNGYCLTETVDPPTSGTCTGSGWSSTAQTSYTFSSDGSKQLWAWARDTSNLISTNVISDTVTVDTVAPTIQSVSSNKANGSYKAGEVIDIDVTFSETISATGYVVVTLDTGGTCQFSLPSGSFGTCNYTVQAGHTSADLNVTNISGTIVDLVGNAMTSFTPTTNLSTNKALVIDTTAPTVLNVTSDSANAIYRTGQTIDIVVTFSETVTSTGNVTVTLETGETDRTCTFTVAGGTTGTCNYTVQTGDFSGDLTVNSVSGTIADVAGNLLTNTTPVTNLAANKNLVINPSVPYIGGATGIGVSIR